MEGLNSVFSAVKRKARGYRNPDYIITMLYFVAGKPSLHSYPSHESGGNPFLDRNRHMEQPRARLTSAP